jgi:hypothetical protein
MMKSPELSTLETSLGEELKLRAEGSHRSDFGKDTLAQSARLHFEDVEFEDMIPLYAAAAIPKNHDCEDEIDDQKSCKAATESPLATKQDTAMKEQFHATSQDQLFGDFVERPEGRKVLPSDLLCTIKCNGPVMCSGSRPG